MPTLTPSATASNTAAPAASATPTRTATTAPPPSNVAMSDLERDMFDRHNAARAAAGVAPLRADGGVMDVARERARDMARTGEFTHSPSNGKTYIALLNAGGVSYRGAGENIAYNTYPLSQTVEVAMRGLLNSPGHYANIVRSSFTHVGIGVAVSADGRDKYFAIVFIGR